jgi:hypothetical protein
MDLREFVKEALLQVVSGVTEAQEAVHAKGGYVNPSALSHVGDHSQTTLFATLSSGQNVFLIDFDVAVTASESVDAGGSAKLSVVSLFSAQVGGKSATSTESVSRIRFKVPLALPLDATSKADFDRQHRQEDEAVRRHNQGYGA